MKRRDFLKTAMATGMLYSAGGLPMLGRTAAGSGFPPFSHRILVNLMLVGGPDLRHLFPPPFTTGSGTYGFRFWEAKAGAHSIGQNAGTYQSRWENDYFHVSGGQTEFGILNTCGWLKRMWDMGNVAIVCNAFGGITRNHAHAQLIIDQGNPTSGPNDYDRSGWGGRLSVAAAGNVLALTRSPRRFCYGPHPTDSENHDNSNLIAATNMRQMSLYNSPITNPTHPLTVMTRALTSYYAAKRQEIDPNSVYHRFVAHEQLARDFGGAIDERLASVPIPSSLGALSQGGLNDVYFARQIQNLYDALACSDIVTLRAASLEYLDWDSHRLQRALIEPRLNDLFGDGKAFDTLFQELPPDAADNVVITIAGEFGRQLRSNLDGGCDHGQGNSILIIGNHVNGGVYGEMFPEEELARLDDPSPQITGLTSLEHVFGEVCEWIVPGGSNIVFPNHPVAPMEAGLNLSGLLT